MRRIWFTIFAISLCSASALASRGSIAYRINDCDYFVVVTHSDYAILEWYGGHDPDKGDVLVGKLEEYGMRDIYDETADENVTIWVEDYNLTKKDVLEQLVGKCEN